MSESAHQDLLVFGYSCKLFRDDERALYIDEGKHLIPWMGDQSMPIDRYDGRGVLTNLKLYEGLTDAGDPWKYLNDKEKKMELQCDEERYRSMNEADECDLAAREEESEKRGLRGEVGFDYSQSGGAPSSEEQEQPSLRTLANCIEKTAEFIVTQGAQMEILMRAREAGNLKFQFLNPDNPYNVIYKQVLETKRNRPKNYVPNAALMKQNSLEVEKRLKILIANLPNSAPNLGTSKNDAGTAITSSSDSAYSRLVERIRENQPQSSTPSPPPPQPTSAEESSSSFPPPANKEKTPPSSSSALPSHVVTVTPPPIAMQPLIDKTASYVAKNGYEQMTVLKKREPVRFSFLKDVDPYNMFFLYKVALYKEMIAEKNEEEQKEKNTQDGKKLDEQTSTKKFPTLKGFFR